MLEDLPDLLAQRCAVHEAPGYSLAVWSRGETWLHAGGVLNRSTGVTADVDTLFQIGSITKLLTAVLVQQLIEEGRFTLDTPVRELVPGFALADGVAGATVTVRQLLCHASGIDGDFFEDTGRGDDKVERYVLAMRALPQLHAPGQGFSYCNAGFVLLGRIIELHCGRSWDEVIRTRLFKPLGMRRFGTQPELALRYRTAIGHVRIPGENSQRLGTPFLAFSNGPAGATPFGPASELLRFARCVLNGGELDGTRLLPTRALEHMWRVPQNAVPQPGMADAFGLGFMRWTIDGREVIGHDGATSGQFAFLRIVPDADLAFVLLTNGGEAHLLFREVHEHIARACGGPLPMAGPVAASSSELASALASRASGAPYGSEQVGHYGRLSAGAEVFARDGRLYLRLSQRRISAPAEEFALTPAADPRSGALLPGVFLVSADGRPARMTAVFLDAPRALHLGGRLYPRND